MITLTILRRHADAHRSLLVGTVGVNKTTAEVNYLLATPTANHTGFLGDGSDEDMRAKADVLKSSFETKSFNGIEKQSEPTVSKLQKETGIKVEIK